MKFVNKMIENIKKILEEATDDRERLHTLAEIVSQLSNPDGANQSPRVIMITLNNCEVDPSETILAMRRYGVSIKDIVDELNWGGYNLEMRMIQEALEKCGETLGLDSAAIHDVMEDARARRISRIVEEALEDDDE